MSSSSSRSVTCTPRTCDCSSVSHKHAFVQNPQSPKQDKGNNYTQNSIKLTGFVTDEGHDGNSLYNNLNESHIDRSPNRVSGETMHEKEIVAESCHEKYENSTDGECPSVDSVNNTLVKHENCTSQSHSESMKEQMVKTTTKPEENSIPHISQETCDLSVKCQNVEGNEMKCVVSVTAKDCQPPEPLLATTVVSSNAVEKKKERLRRKKELAKDEKRRQRELEFRKNLEFPLGQRIQVIDRNTFQKILNEASLSHNDSKTSVLSVEQFPALKTPKPNNRIPPLFHEGSPLLPENENSELSDRTVHHELKFGKSTEISKDQINHLIDHNMFQKTSKEASASYKGNKNSMLSVEQFPNLPKTNNSILSLSDQDTSVLSDNKKLKVYEVTANQVRPFNRVLGPHFNANSRTTYKTGKQFGISNKSCNNGSVKKAGRLPKKCDPIQVDILQCIKMVKSKEAALESKRQLTSLEKEGKKKESLVIGGNELDASNPQRSRGKKREQPKKKKPTRLKLVILRERELKSQLKKLQDATLPTVGHKFLEGSQSINDMTLLGSQQMNSNSKELTSITVGTKPEIGDESEACGYFALSSKDGNTQVTNHSLYGDDEQQRNLQRNQTGEQRHVNISRETPDSVSFISSQPSHVLKNHSSELAGLIKDSSSNIKPKEGQHSKVTSDDSRKISQFSSNAENSIVTAGSKEVHCNTNFLSGSSSASNSCNVPQQNAACGGSSGDKETVPKAAIHSRKFMPYCDHFITPEINTSITALVQDIVKFHDRQYERDPVKANARRRHVVGLREVLKYLKLKRLKLVIIAPDMELIKGKGGICDIVEQLKEGAKNQEIPYVFALHRRLLGKLTFKKVPVSCIGVINYDGTEKNFHSLMAALPVARTQYQEALANAVQKDKVPDELDINKQVVAAVISKLTEDSFKTVTKTSQESEE